MYYGSEFPATYRFSLWVPQYPWYAASYAMFMFFYLSAFLHTMSTFKLSAKNLSHKKYLFEFVKRICKRFWALYSTSFCVLFCVIPLLNYKNLTSLCPFAFTGYFNYVYGGPWWFSICLFTIELCVAHPIDLFVHFCYAKSKSY